MCCHKNRIDEAIPIYTYNIHFSRSKICRFLELSRNFLELKNESESDKVNKPSVFKSLRFYYILLHKKQCRKLLIAVH